MASVRYSKVRGEGARTRYTIYSGHKQTKLHQVEQLLA